MQQIDINSLNYLDLIPDKLYQRLITHSYRASSNHNSNNSLQLRAMGILQIRQQLLKGEKLTYSSLGKWLDEKLLLLFYEKLNNKWLLESALNNESFTDDVLLHALNWLDQIEGEINKDEFVNHARNNFDFKSNNTSKKLSGRVDVDDINETQTMQSINKDFALERHIGWDLSAGINSKTEVNLLLKVHQKIKKSKKITNIIGLIGRGKFSSFDSIAQSGLNLTKSKGDRSDAALPDEHALNSVTGVCYGDDVSRMLSSEMAFLGHAKLKMLWHSKRAERQLLNYHYKGLMSEHVPEVQATSIDKDKKGKQAIKTKGPIILCVDTSASMKGRPELLSKAIALETMRIAHLENRSCYLFCFGGRGELMELDLSLKLGWNKIIEFLSYRFDGGTDVNHVLLHAAEKIKIANWKQADIILLSDGRFNAANETPVKFNIHSRVFGIQLGKWNTQAFNLFCHHVFNLSDA